MSFNLILGIISETVNTHLELVGGKVEVGFREVMTIYIKWKVFWNYVIYRCKEWLWELKPQST